MSISAKKVETQHGARNLMISMCVAVFFTSLGVSTYRRIEEFRQPYFSCSLSSVDNTLSCGSMK